MLLAVSWTQNRKVSARAQQAQEYRDKGDGYRDHPCPGVCWLSIESDADSVGIRLTNEQLTKLVADISKMRPCVECGDLLGDVPPAVNVCAACESKPIVHEEE